MERRRRRRPDRADRGAGFRPRGHRRAGSIPTRSELAIDGNPEATAWPTETYTAAPAMLEDGKSGVGLIVDAGEPVAARNVQLALEDGGWSRDLRRRARARRTRLDGWGDPLGGADDVEHETRPCELNRNEPSRYYLIWITELSPAGGPGDYKVDDLERRADRLTNQLEPRSARSLSYRSSASSTSRSQSSG